MAKVPKVKGKAVSFRARAARRQASPSIDVDKSLKDVRLPKDDTSGSAGDWIVPISQNLPTKSKQRVLKRSQRLRKERGQERANAVADRTENKVAKSKRKSKTIKSRAATWDDLNEAIGVQPKGTRKQKISTQTAREILQMDMDLDEDGAENASSEDDLPDPRAALVFADGTTAADAAVEIDEIA